MPRRRLLDDPRDIDLHFDGPLRPSRQTPDDSSSRKSINAFPPIEYTVQRTHRAVYYLARGVSESLDVSTAKAIANWLGEVKGIAVSRHGPSAYPGPDGTQYEWFFRVDSVDGQTPQSLDEIDESSRSRLLVARQRAISIDDSSPALIPIGTPQQPLGLNVSEISGAEIARATSYLAREIHRLHRRLADSLRALRILRSATKEAPTRTIDATVDRAVVDRMWAELTVRDEHLSGKEKDLSSRETLLATRATWIEAQYQRLSSATQEDDRNDVEFLDRLLPRIILDEETKDLLLYELIHRSAYMRFLGAMNDRCDIAKHPCCKKHEKVKEAPGKVKAWWEVRLVDSIADDYRLYYRHNADDQLDVRVRHKKDQQKFFATL